MGHLHGDIHFFPNLFLKGIVILIGQWMTQFASMVK